MNVDKYIKRKDKIVSDLGKGVTFGDADGPNIFIPEFGFIVPTFVDPRIDLIPARSLKRFKRVNYHVPFKMRGFFSGLDWPEEFRSTIEWREDDDGYVLCNATSERNDGKKCRSKAVNRTQFCRSHGGGLHPLDKKMSIKSTVPAPQDRVEKLNRPQKFMQGFLPIEEISDEEIQGMFLYNDDGTRVSSMTLGVKIHQQLAQELHRRMNRFLQTKTASMLQVMVDIAESELVEPADRIKAAQWVAERTLGKTPDIIMHGKVDAPYEAIFETIDAGSREDYRTQVASARLELGGTSDSYLDAEIIEQSEDSDLEPVAADRQDESGSGYSDHGSSLEHARRASEKRDDVDRQKEIRKARAKAKQRRYAARAAGVATTQDLPWMIEWKFIDKGKYSGCFTMKLVCPDEQTESKIGRVIKSNEKALELAEIYRRKNAS